MKRFQTKVRFTGALWIGALVLASNAVFADVTITRLANEGVIIDDGVSRIMIDGLVVEPYALYGGLPPDLAEQFSQAEGIFADVDLALASHQHHDHNQPEFACKFLLKSTRTRMVSSQQVADLMRERCRDFITGSARFRVVDPQYGAPLVVAEETADITIIRLSHGTGKYARLQNFGHLVKIDGMNILHIGDAAMAEKDFEIADLDQVTIDVALVPFWFFQPGPGMAVVERFMDARHKLAVHIPPGEMVEVQQYLAENYPSVEILTRPGDAVVISRPSPVQTAESPN